MDIIWDVNQRFTTETGRVIEVAPSDIWENVKLGGLRFSIEEKVRVMSIDYDNCIFPAIPVGNFRLVD